MNERMDGWLDGWVDRWMNEWMDKHKDEWFVCLSEICYALFTIMILLFSGVGLIGALWRESEWMLNYATVFLFERASIKWTQKNRHIRGDPCNNKYYITWDRVQWWRFQSSPVVCDATANEVPDNEIWHSRGHESEEEKRSVGFVSDKDMLSCALHKWKWLFSLSSHNQTSSHPKAWLIAQILLNILIHQINQEPWKSFFFWLKKQAVFVRTVYFPFCCHSN